MRDVYKILVGKSEGKRLPRRTGYTWENNIKMYLRETWLGGVAGIHLALDREQWWALVNTVMKLQVP
jgi:hypothetical protein